MSEMSVRASARRRGIAVSLAVLALLALSSASFAATKAKYVFLMIGDGMALPQRNAAEIFLAAEKDATKPGIIRLAMNELPAQGMCTTYSTNSLITDSAAAATAFACGEKTKSGVIAMDPKGERKLPIITQLAKASGRKIGIVSSVSIDHATPAAFYAHAAGRSVYYGIALQLAESGFDFFAGGGLKKPKGDKGDQPDAFEAIAKAGYSITRTRDDFLKLNAASGKVMAVNPVLDRDKALSYEIDRKDGEITLAEFTAKGIELLDNPNGFFMMVEGGKIDWACHANDAATVICDIFAFNDAVKEAIAFAEKHPDETLIVVVGDHETGGMSIGFAGTQYETFFEKIAHQKESYESFDKKIAAFRKGEEKTFEKMAPMIEESFGLRTATAEERAALEEKAKAGDDAARIALSMTLTDLELGELRHAFEESMLEKKERAKDEATYLLYGGYEPLSVKITHILNRKAGIGWTTYAHTGIPVPIFAKGLGSELFAGYYDNTDVAWKIMSVLGVR